MVKCLTQILHDFDDFVRYAKNSKEEVLVSIMDMMVKPFSVIIVLAAEVPEVGEDYVKIVRYVEVHCITETNEDPTKVAWKNIIEYYGRYLESDILLAPGHGSPNHVSTELLDIIRPRLTIVSVAEGVDYDYATYRNYGRVLSTKHFGNIQVRIDQHGEITFRTQFHDYSDNWYILGERSFYYRK